MSLRLMDQLVKTPNGDVPIQDIKEGDLVISRFGRPLKVAKIGHYGRKVRRGKGGHIFIINGEYHFHGHQSIYANGNVTHVKLLKIGDLLVDESGNIIKVESIGRTSGKAKHFINFVLEEKGLWDRLKKRLGGPNVNAYYYLNGLLVHNASRFWVGGTATWDATAGTKWATTTGGLGGSSVPTSSDDVFMDGPSGANTVTMAATGTVCRSIDCTGFTGTWDRTGNTMSVGDASGGAFKLAATMAGYTVSSSQLNLISTSNNGGTGWRFTTGGKTIGPTTFNGLGGKWVLQDTYTSGSSSVVTLTAGELSTNDQTCNWSSFNSSNSNVRILTNGASNITVTATGTAWDCGTSTNLTVNPGSSTITMNGTSGTFNGGAKTWNNLALTGAGGAFIGQGGTTFNNLTRTGTNTKTDTLGWNTSVGFTVTGTLTINGNTVTNRLLVFNNAGGKATITCSNPPVLSNVDFQDTIAAGAGGTWAGTSIGNSLGNTNITFDVAVDQYWGAYTNGTYLHLPGVASFYASSPDSAATSVTGNLDIRAKAALNDWTPVASTSVIGKWTSVANQKAYVLQVNPAGASGTLRLAYSINGSTTLTADSTAAPTVADGATLWIRATRVASTGVIKFYTSSDGSSWTQLGTDVAGTSGNLTDTTALVEIGSNDSGANNIMAGNVYEAQIRNNVLDDGTGIQFNVNFAQSVGTHTFTESSSNAATVTINNTNGNWSTAALWLTRVPLPQDNVFIPANAGTITVDMPRMGSNVDFTNFTGTGSFNSLTNTAFGNWTFGSGMTVTGTSQFQLQSRSVGQTITSNGKTFTQAVAIGALGGSYTLQDAFISNSIFTLSAGTFSSNTKALTASSFTSTGTPNRSAVFDGSDVRLTGSGNVINISGWGASQGSFSAVGSTWTLSDVTGNQKAITPGGSNIHYGNITITGGGAGAIALNSGVGQTFNVDGTWTIGGPKTIIFHAGFTYTVGRLVARGTAGNLITMQSDTPGTPFILSSAGSVIFADFLSLQDSTATGGADWNAGANSVNVSGNSGWGFDSNGNMSLADFVTTSDASAKTSTLAKSDSVLTSDVLSHAATYMRSLLDSVVASDSLLASKSAGQVVYVPVDNPTNSRTVSSPSNSLVVNTEGNSGIIDNEVTN